MKKTTHIPRDSDIYFQLVYPKIIEVLRLVSAEPEIQNKAFPKEEFPPEEIGFLVEHATIMANTLYQNEYIKKEQLDSIMKLDQKFEAFEKKEWTIDAMYNSRNWHNTRILALQTLREFLADQATPNLYWYSIRGRFSD